MLDKDIMLEFSYSDIILTGIFVTGLFWVIRTISKDRKRKTVANKTGDIFGSISEGLKGLFGGGS
jgi:hypothetical protein